MADNIVRSAYLDGNYRYFLGRKWDCNMPSCLFVMLNPSTADANQDDPTIRRCMHFARANSCGELWVANLYAWRATSPKNLFEATDPVGSGNDYVLDFYAKEAGKIIVAWGSHGKEDRAAQVLSILMRYPLYCLGKNRNGSPKHPLYIKGDKQVEVFSEPWESNS